MIDNIKKLMKEHSEKHNLPTMRCSIFPHGELGDVNTAIGLVDIRLTYNALTGEPCGILVLPDWVEIKIKETK